jgi:hypothetical protein
MHRDNLVTLKYTVAQVTGDGDKRVDGDSKAVECTKDRSLQINNLLSPSDWGGGGTGIMVSVATI